jgi:hypothetical protein
MAATSLTASFEAARARVPILVVVGRRLALVDDAFTALCVAIIIVVVVIVVVIRVVEYGARTTPTPPLYPLRRRCRVVTPPVHRIAHRIASVEVFIHDANAERDGRGDASIDRFAIHRQSAPDDDDDDDDGGRFTSSESVKALTWRCAGVGANNARHDEHYEGRERGSDMVVPARWSASVGG